MLTTMIFAKDHDAMVAFYAGGFGLEVVAAESSDGYTVLADDGVRLSIHAVPPDVAEGITITDPPQVRRDGVAKLLFGVADPGATRARLAGLGAQLLESSTDDAFDGCDVEGNVFRVSKTR